MRIPIPMTAIPMTIIDAVFNPFADFAFMRQALVAGLALALSSVPVGVFLFYRRMSLMGDALQHAILPGVAMAYFLFGLSLPAMTIGGLLAGLAVALAAGVISRLSRMKEDGSFAALYLIALSLGVLLISLRRNPVDLMHILFGNILAINGDTLFLLVGTAAITMLLIAVFYRGMVLEAVDSVFLNVIGGKAGFYHFMFIALAVINLVAGFQAMGALMALGLMIIPAAAAGFWSRMIDKVILIAVGTAILSVVIGLLLSFYADWPSGPAIVLVAGFFYMAAVLAGRYNSVRARYFPSPHLVE
jgi:zinc/manganese transport system permease protein